MTVHFGALAPPLSKQVAPGVFFANDLRLFQGDADAIVRLYCRGFLTDREVHRARLRLVKKMNKCTKKKTP